MYLLTYSFPDLWPSSSSARYRPLIDIYLSKEPQNTLSTAFKKDKRGQAESMFALFVV